jgi:hypothetical protein
VTMPASRSLGLVAQRRLRVVDQPFRVVAKTGRIVTMLHKDAALDLPR